MKIKKDFIESAYTYFKIHSKRLFSPFGPASPILNLEAENKYQSFSYLFYSYFIFIGSFLFFSLVFLFFKNIIFFIISSLLIIISLLLKQKFFKDTSLYHFFVFIFITFLIEALSFLIFYLTNLIFLEKINIYDSFISYLIWVIISSIFPILYGTGPSEILSLIYIYYLGYNPYLFLLSLIYFRLITTYLPIIGLSIKYLKLSTKSIDK